MKSGGSGLYPFSGSQVPAPRTFESNPAITQPGRFISGSGEEAEGGRQTPRKRDEFEEESKKTDGASTPSRNGADTPTRKEFIDHQQRMDGLNGTIHDLTIPHQREEESEFFRVGSNNSQDHRVLQGQASQEMERKGNEQHDAV